jgi:hypothetical protein
MESNDTEINDNSFASTFYFLQRTKQLHEKLLRGKNKSNHLSSA